MVAAVNGGQTLAQAAATNRARVVASSRTIDRRSAAQGLPQGLAGQMFAVGEGTAFSEVGPGGVLIAVVERINRADIAAADPQILEATRLTRNGHAAAGAPGRRAALLRRQHEPHGSAAVEIVSAANPSRKKT